MVHVTYYTDPACPWSWAAEPAVRRIGVEFGDQVEITYVMVGLARELEDPLHELQATLDACAASGMPADPRLWVQRPPSSTYPACRAVKAAAEQGLDGRYLRRLREGLFLDSEPLDTADALIGVARRTAGLDVARFESDLRSEAIAEAFGADLDRSRAVPDDQLREAGDRIGVPRFAIGDRFVRAHELSDAVAHAGARPGVLPTVAEAVRLAPRSAAAEIAAMCGVPLMGAQVALWHLAAEWRVRPEAVLFGEVWHAA